MAFLRKLDGTRTYALRPRLTLIGRDAGCDIAVADNQISGRHAIVVNDSGRCFIEDLHSLNGTSVNGVRIKQRTVLAAGSFCKRMLESVYAGPTPWRAGAAGLLRNLGPYAVIELLLPGGSLLVLLLWLYRRHSAARSASTAAGYA